MYNFQDAPKHYIHNAQGAVQDWNLPDKPITPNNKSHVGIDSAGRHQVAPYLPVLRRDEEFYTHVVVSAQTPVAHATYPDGRSFLVPAGYAILLEKNDTALKYTKEDVRAGIKNAQGTLVTDGESVIASIKAANILISPFCGVANYNYLRNAGGNGVNPSTLDRRNYNPQPGVSYSMDYAFEFPMVKDQATLDAAPLAGIAAFVGKKAVPGQFVTYDEKSNFVLASENDFEYGTVKPQRIIGQVSAVVKFKDPDTDQATGAKFEQLDQVVNPHVFGQTVTGINGMPGANTDGLTTKLTYSNGYGLITFNLQTR